MEFRKANLSDKNVIESFVKTEGDLNCETDFINILLWQNLYGAEVAIGEDTLLMRVKDGEGYIFVFPFGNMEKGYNEILKITDGKCPVFRAQEGKRLEEFSAKFGEHYNIHELPDGVDYIYLRENLAELHGKKYHSKRNHISAFSKQFDWQYEEINKDNLADVKICADRWYKENAERFTGEMKTEQKGVDFIIEHFEETGVLGGAIRVDGHIVAFTFASYINDSAIDIHIEKALADYATAYTVINNQFVLHLPQTVKYINREDDLGLEGLRKAKLSYHPEKQLKKYICEPKEHE